MGDQQPVCDAVRFYQAVTDVCGVLHTSLRREPPLVDFLHQHRQRGVKFRFVFPPSRNAEAIATIKGKLASMSTPRGSSRRVDVMSRLVATGNTF